MSAAPRPDNDLQRIAALDATGVLTRGPDPALERLARAAAEAAGTPMALVSFVTDDRQWIKASVGTDLQDTSRDSAFCAWAIYTADLLWVEDALKDERFADNPLVCAHPHIRHYAGAPILTPDGFALGALCVLDSVPHAFDSKVAPTLRRLARDVSRALETGADPAGAPLGRVA